MNSRLFEILNLNRITEVVDIGANPIDGETPYKNMLDMRLCRVTGFEPQELALNELNIKMGPFERYLPYAVGDGRTHILKICKASGMTSLLKPDFTKLKIFDVLAPLAEVLHELPIKTVRLDDISEIELLDFLKIDIQGGELAVFLSGKKKLSKAAAIQVEVSFMTLYENQPTLGDIDLELRTQGFVPHCFAAIKKWPISPCIVNNNPRQPLNQLLEADLVYVRDFSKPETISDDQFKHLAMVAHYCYHSYDLTLNCLQNLEKRSALPVGAQQEYIFSLGNNNN